MNILPHEYNGQMIYQLLEDTIIAGRSIPKGYVSATLMIQAAKEQAKQKKRKFGKNLSKYLAKESTKEYYQVLIENESRNPIWANGDKSTPFSLEQIIIVIKGGDDLSLQGTWLHPEAAINFAQWLSPEFAYWAAKNLRLIIQKDFAPLTEEARVAQEKLQSIWAELRALSKVNRRKATDAIRDWIVRHNYKEKYQGQMYVEFSDIINVALFGMTARQLREFRGIESISELLRDSHDGKELEYITEIEKHAMRLIDKKNWHPIDAVKDAIEMCLD